MVAVLAQMISAQGKRSTMLSEQLSIKLAELVPGGVNSPFRSFEEVGGHTIFLRSASGSKVFDVDGNSYIDYLGAWGPAILGHCHPAVIQACQAALVRGPVFGAPCELELEFAQVLTEAVPGLEQVRFVNSGAEAVMSAVRLARGATGRDKVILFEGCYHGHSDSTLASRKHSASAGIPHSYAQNGLLVEFNNLEALEKCLQEHKNEIAAALIEPIAGSMGVIPPEPGYLQKVRELCTAYGVVLIFDEVLTGFRVALGGAQEVYGIKADLTCYGKALAGGMPIGVYGGSKDLMSRLKPIGDVYQAGTFSGNPVTMAGGIATIKQLSDPAVYLRLETLSKRFFDGIQTLVDRMDLTVQLQRVGSLFAIIFASHQIRNYTDSLSIDAKAYARFFQSLLKDGIYMVPSSIDAACISIAHTEEEIDYTIEKIALAFRGY
jgi:glutamate-1-semialdehyde 2,1-aminomutase